MRYSSLFLTLLLCVLTSFSCSLSLDKETYPFLSSTEQHQAVQLLIDGNYIPVYYQKDPYSLDNFDRALHALVSTKAITGCVLSANDHFSAHRGRII